MSDQVRIFLASDRCIVGVSGQNLIKQPTRVAGRNCQDPEAEVQQVDRAAVVEVPSVTTSGRERHLSRGGHFERFHLGHSQSTPIV
jgi:hypothetical protein